MNSLREFEFEQVAVIHAQRLLRFALKFCGDRSCAEDLVQETLLSAWSNFHQFETGTNCRAWLFKILVNLRHKNLSRLRGQPAPLSIDRQQMVLAAPENISNSAEVRAAFRSLPAEHRAILQLGVVEGFSVKELARLLAIPPGTVMSRLSRARAKLRTALRPLDSTRPCEMARLDGSGCYIEP